MGSRPTTRRTNTAPQTTRSNPRRPKPDPQRLAEAKRPSRARWIAIAAATLLVAGIAGAFYLTRDAREVTVDDAVNEFRAGRTVEVADETTPPTAEPAATQAARAVPKKAAPKASPRTATAAKPAAPRAAPIDEGVYVYATEGYEQTDALSGQRHDYPSETVITVKKGGCGWTSRWQPLKERWESNEFCEDATGSRMKTYTMYHEFFRRGVTESFACDGYAYKIAAKPGDSWTMTCKSDRSTATSKNTVIGFETLNVGGEAVRTMHIRYDITTTGANRGKLIQDRWLAESPRRMVKVVQTADLETDSPFGPVGYKESFTINLKSLEPRR